jgi:hypothetical protein
LVAHDRPIAIRALKRFVCDLHGPEAREPLDVLADLREHAPEIGADSEEMAALLRAGIQGRFKPAGGERIAIVGAGPAGLAAAHDLALLGFRPVVYESEKVPAGMLGLGIPAYRLPRELIRREIAVIEALGVEIRCGVTVGVDLAFAELRRTHAAVLIAVGAKASRGLNLPGERGPGVFGGVDLLRAVSLGERFDLGRDVLVIGGGNVAYDVARTVLRPDRRRHRAHGQARRARRTRPAGFPGNTGGNAGGHPGDPRRRRRGGRAPERMGAAGDPTRRRRARDGRAGAPLPARVRRGATLRPGVRRRAAPDHRVRHRAAGGRPVAQSGLPRRRWG